jgi:hypothetical protein
MEIESYYQSRHDFPSYTRKRERERERERGRERERERGREGEREESVVRRMSCLVILVSRSRAT